MDKLDAREKWYEIYYKEKKVKKTGGKNKVCTTQIIQKRILPEAPFPGVCGVFGVEVLLSWSKVSFSTIVGILFTCDIIQYVIHYMSYIFISVICKSQAEL